MCSSIANPGVAPLVIWRFSDGKRGHDNQSLGLVDALATLRPVDTHTLRAPPLGVTLKALLLRSYSMAAALPAPDLIIGAGHATHLPMLAARRARGGRAVVLMKPSLPRWLFDLCIVPRHDGVSAAEGILITDGALNRIVPSGVLESTRGLVLIGGPSRHYRWDDRKVLEQVRTVIESMPEVRWQLADSRRTPPSLCHALRGLALPGVEYFHHAEVSAEWLPAQLVRCAIVWVTADSVSMLYEALTAGAAVGLLELAEVQTARGRKVLEPLLVQGRVVRYSDWRAGVPLRAAREPLHEAARCARWIFQHWFS